VVTCSVAPRWTLDGSILQHHTLLDTGLVDAFYPTTRHAFCCLTVAFPHYPAARDGPVDCGYPRVPFLRTQCGRPMRVYYRVYRLLRCMITPSRSSSYLATPAIVLPQQTYSQRQLRCLSAAARLVTRCSGYARTALPLRVTLLPTNPRFDHPPDAPRA